MPRHARIAAALAFAMLTACSPPQAPQEERRPEPQAAAQSQSEIVRTAEAYKERARSAESRQLDAADQQRAQIDAATR
jgi:outer membrane biogenesis lipoprotein LolB